MKDTLRDIYLNYHHTYPLKDNMRFELAHGERDRPFSGIENAKVRAKVLFEEVFGASQTIQLVFVLPQYAKRANIKKYLNKNKFKLIDSFETQSWSDFYTNDTTILVAETEISNFRKNKIIDALCYRDFICSQKMVITYPVIFFNSKETIVLNIYDDRGCDIWTNNLEWKERIQKKYSSWLIL